MKKHVLILAALLGITTLFSCNAQKRVDASALVETIGSMTEDTNFVVTGELTDDMLNEIGNAVRNGNYEVGLDLLKTTGLTKIGDGAFWGCTGLEKITVSEENKVYDSRNNCNAIISTEDNILIVGCKNTEIPDSVTYIGGGAFSACTRLTSITIPDSVTRIGSEAFKGCTNLKNINASERIKEMVRKAM